ncbi:Protein CBG19609 [Caenorhabditis briggsae]|uniref:Protein CBG19609 n=1 Tax=Caenorhabditis briggsae TaxID=6238 RepID=A8XW04_CAEBR|nr:Protein CBG19609 [Caenorhabditis briggsae]CAP36823.2 Protein CBG19609 [Caenorhabditis briggsae]
MHKQLEPSFFSVGLSIINNTELTDISFLNAFFLTTDRLTQECILKFENNPQLDASHLCDHFKDLFELRISGNFKNCGCRGDSIISENLETLENCKILNGGLRISNWTENSEFNISRFSSISHIKGDVEIWNTNFKNLSFLKNLKKIETKHGLVTESVSINIHDNLEMTRFEIPNLKIFYEILEGPFILNLENLHPDFCLSFQEMLFFLEIGASFKNIHAKYCEESRKLKINDYEICNFKSMKSLKDGCMYIYGNVLMDSGDEKYVFKLKSLDGIFGTLTIKNTKLENLNFLDWLRYIASLEDDYVIEILSNENLNIITKGSRTVVVNNNPLLESDDCMLFPLSYQANVAFLGDNCVLSYLLIKCMKEAAKSRKSLGKNHKDSEISKSIKMVTLMTVCLMIAEGPIGIVHAIVTFYYDYAFIIGIARSRGISVSSVPRVTASNAAIA